MLFKLVIIGMLLAVLYNLGAALFYMMRSDGRDMRMVNSLTWRIGISVAIFILIIIAAAMGWIQTNPTPS